MTSAMVGPHTPAYVLCRYDSAAITTHIFLMTETKGQFLSKTLTTVVNELNGQITTIIILYVAVLLVVMLDLWSGLRKAHRIGQYRSSYGLRKTVDKLASYFNMLLVLTVIDVMQILSFYHLNPQLSFDVPLFPVLTLIGAVFAGVIELKSIYEKANDKDKGRYQETARLINEIMKMADNKELYRMIEYFKTDKNEKEANK